MLDLTGYQLTFDEEFNSISISQGGGTVWSDIRPGSRMSPVADIGFGNSAFVDSASGSNPFSLHNGALDITAVPASSDIVGPGQWASGLISTQYSFAQEYGYFEMRAMLPADVGVWPAFWMLPASGAWPPELDVFEAYGGPWDIGTAHTASTFYGGSPGADNYEQIWSNQPSMTTGFHTYGVMWDPQHITFYFDGNVTGQLPTPPDMHQPMYLLADLAMQALSGVTSDPKHFDLDYIRAYSNNPNSTAVALAPISSPDGVDTSNLHGATHAPAGTTTEPFSPETLGNIVYAAEFGLAPSSTELNTLLQFIIPQYTYGQQIGVMDPIIYAYQSLGVALASTAEHFQSTFGTSRYSASPSGDIQFVVNAYTSVFGSLGSEAEVQHFIDQLAHFENLYSDTSLFGGASNIDLLARGAIYGQMLGIQHEIGQTGASIIGIATTLSASV